MPYDCSAPRRPMTAASALLAYDSACHTGELESLAEAAHALAEVLRAKPKAKPRGERTPAETIAAALAPIVAVIEARNALPILSTVRLTVAGGRLTLAGTDLDMLASTTLDACGLPPIDVCLDARALAKALKVKGEVFAAVDGESVVLTVAGVRYRLPARLAGDFPAMVPDAYAFAVSLPGESLAEALAPVAACVSTEEDRYYLNGAYLHAVHQGPLRLVATDGHRLTYVDLPGAEVVGEVSGSIIPRKVVEWLLKHAAAGPVTIEGSAAQLRVTCAAGELVCKLIEGSFPDYMRCVPRDGFTAKATLGADAAAVLGRLAAQSDSKYPAVALTLAAGELHGRVADMEGGEFTAQIPASEVSGEGHIGFNVAYLRAALAHGEAVLMLQGNDGPARLEYPEHPARVGVLMPLRI